jgi:biotin synthase-like enzyme
VAVVRLVQRVLTNDCGYCAQSSRSLHEHGMVVAVEIEPTELQDARAILAERGGHSFVYGEHWNFVVVPVEMTSTRGT